MASLVNELLQAVENAHTKIIENEKKIAHLKLENEELRQDGLSAMREVYRLLSEKIDSGVTCLVGEYAVTINKNQPGDTANAVEFSRISKLPE